MPEVWKLCEADLSSAKTHNINTREAEEGAHTLMQASAASVFNVALLGFLSVSENRVQKRRVHPGVSGS